MTCSVLAGSRARALQRVASATLADAKRRFLDKAMADGRGGQHATGVRWWFIYCVYGRGVSPIQDPRDSSWETAVAYEDLLEDMAVWIAVCRPSGRQVSHGSVAKYVSEVRGWYRRFYRARLGLGAEGSRINDVLKGYAREVPQPPQLERHGCSPRDLVRGLEAIGASRMWRAATMFAESILARGCEIARDSGRGDRRGLRGVGAHGAERRDVLLRRRRPARACPDAEAEGPARAAR